MRHRQEKAANQGTRATTAAVSRFQANPSLRALVASSNATAAESARECTGSAVLRGSRGAHSRCNNTSSREERERNLHIGEMRLGKLTPRDGQGVPQNYTEAPKWFQKAVDQGNYTEKTLEFFI